MNNYNNRLAQQQSGMNSLFGLGGQLGAAYLMAPSDIRIKEDIKTVGHLDNGLPVYLFRYKGSPQFHIGLMAQEVEQVKPKAVMEINGIKHVNYSEAVQ